MKKHVVQFFSRLYYREDTNVRPYPLIGLVYPLVSLIYTIDNSMIFILQRPVDEVEIKNTIFSMKSLKALGWVDSLHAIFYKTQRNIVGPSFCLFIKDIFCNNKILEDINNTLLVHIPKNENPIKLKMYCPISSCAMAYKTITLIVYKLFCLSILALIRLALSLANI